MNQDISTRLAKVVEQKILKAKLARDLDIVENEIREKTARLESLSSQLNKEKVDVEKLERLSLTGLFYSVLGSREQQLEVERQELLSAQLTYQRARHQIDFLLRDRDRLIERLDVLQDVDLVYDSLLSEKESLLNQSGSPVGAKLLKLTEQIAHLESDKKEVSQAITAGENVLSSLEKVIESLESAGNWGTWDMLGGGLVSTAIKHSRIDDARKYIHEVETKISLFKRELADVHEISGLQINITEFESFADYFFDNLITDWIVQSRIVESLSQSKSARIIIKNTLEELGVVKNEILSRISSLNEEKAQLIEQA
jgi:hypothetical protein